MIGLAQTGSGKTGAFCLPILQGLLDKPQELYALVLSPTRELAIQIAEQVEAVGSLIGVRCAVLVGGIDMMAQAISLAKRPHVIVGTPGRVVDHLSNTKVSCWDVCAVRAQSARIHTCKNTCIHMHQPQTHALLGRLHVTRMLHMQGPTFMHPQISLWVQTGWSPGTEMHTWMHASTRAASFEGCQLKCLCW